MTQLRPGHAGAPWRLPGSWGSRGQGARRTEGPSGVRAQPRPPTSPEDPGGRGRREGGIPPPLQLRKFWSQAGSGQDRPLLANFCPTPTRAHHPCLRRSPWDLLGNQLLAEEGGGRGREGVELGSFPEVGVCLQTSFFAKAVWHLCVWRGGRGGRKHGERARPFLPSWSRLPRRAISLKRQRALIFLFLFHPPASLDKPLWGRGSFKGDCDL